MVASDDPSMKMIYKQMFVENGFDVAEAANGMEAIAVYKDFQPDMVFMEISMPDGGGLAALKEIKKFDPYAKVVMISAMGQQPLVKEALKTRDIDFVVMPFDEERFFGIIKKTLS